MSSRLSKLCVSAAAMAAVFCSPVQAATENNWYIGASVGYATSSTSNISWPSGTSIKKNDTGFKLYGGYQFTNIFAAELEYIDLGAYKAESSTVVGSVDVSGLGGSLVARLPMSDSIALFGKAGLLAKFTDAKSASLPTGATRYASKRTSTAPLLGVGLEYKMTPSLALRAEYNYIGSTKLDDNTNEKISNGLTSIGLRYAF